MMTLVVAQPDVIQHLAGAQHPMGKLSWREVARSNVTEFELLQVRLLLEMVATLWKESEYTRDVLARNAELELTDPVANTASCWCLYGFILKAADYASFTHRCVLQACAFLADEMRNSDLVAQGMRHEFVLRYHDEAVVTYYSDTHGYTAAQEMVRKAIAAVSKQYESTSPYVQCETSW